MGEREAGILRLNFDRRLKLEFHGSKVASDAGLLPYRELDDALGLTEIAGDVLTDTRRGKNARHGLVGQFGASFTPWPTIWPTLCGHWLCRRRSSTGL